MTVKKTRSIQRIDSYKRQIIIQFKSIAYANLTPKKWP